MNTRTHSTWGIGLVSLAILVAVIILNWWIFRYFAHVNYFLWYLTNGTLIAIVVGFAATVWEGLELRKDLLSAHPAYYLYGCIGLMSAYMWSSSVALDNNPPLFLMKREHPEFNFSFDKWVTLVVVIITGILMLAWLIVVAPLNYFVTLLAGSLARRELAEKCPRAMAVQTRRKEELNDLDYSYKSVTDVVLNSIPRQDPLPDHSIDISLAAKPFVMTQSIGALLLFIAKLLFT